MSSLAYASQLRHFLVDVLCPLMDPGAVPYS